MVLRRTVYADELTTSLIHNCNIFCHIPKTVGEFASKKSLRHGKCMYQMEKHRTPLLNEIIKASKTRGIVYACTESG